MPQTGLTILAVLLIAVVMLVVINRPRTIVVNATVPDDFPNTGFSHAGFERLLQRYVREDGGVDYTAWHASAQDRERLAAYLAAVAGYSPENAPERFGSPADELAYWMYAYNATVIYGVLAHWPLASVTDVKAPVEIVKGFGFFWQRRYIYGGKALSLYTVENDRIRKHYRGARIHFVLNCASDSCPLMRPELPNGEELEPFLQQAAIDFVSDPRNVQIDHEQRRLRLSRIFKWYRKDFIDDLRFRGLPAGGGLLDYIRSVAPDTMQADLAAAADYDIEFAEYDWTVNET